VKPNSAVAGREYGFAALFLGAALLAVYSVVLTRYGFSDDYCLLFGIAKGWSLLDITSQQGRPLLSLCFSLFSLATSVDTLNRLRLLGLVGAFLFELVFYHILRRSGKTVLFSLALSLLVCLTPGFALCVAWTTTASYALVGALALVAGTLIWYALEENNRLRARIYAGCGIVSLLLVYLIFQPLGGFAVLPLLAFSSGPDRLNWETIRKFALATLILLGTALLYYLAYKISIYALHVGGQAYRAAPPSDLLGKARYLVTTILWHGVTGWAQFSGPRTQTIVAVVVIALCCYGCMDTSRGALLCIARVICCLAGVVFTVLPLAAIRENMFFFREETELYGVVCLLFLSGLSRLFDQAESRGKVPASVRWGFYGGVVLGVALVTHNIITEFVYSAAHEMSVLGGAVKKMNAFPDKIIYITPPLWKENGDKLGEYGFVTSPERWVSRDMLELLFIREYEPNIPLGVALARHANFQVYAGPENGQSAPVINGFQLLGGCSPPVNNPYWGNVRMKSGWCCSKWLGVFDNRLYPMIYHSELGWLRCEGKANGGYWFFSNQLGNVWTSPKSFPSIYSEDQKSWLVFSRDIWRYGSGYPGCMYFNTNKKKWCTLP
jgi:hypothetical protein